MLNQHLIRCLVEIPLKLKINGNSHDKKYGILLPKLFWPTVWKKCSSYQENFWNSRLKAKKLKFFEITRTIYSNSERSEQFMVTECFFNLFLLTPNKLEQSEFKMEKIIGKLQEKLENTFFRCIIIKHSHWRFLWMPP